MSTRSKTKPWPGVRRLQALILDFDGVLTDNRVWVDEHGRESVACHRGDGMGIGLLVRAGLPVLVLSTERNPVVAARCAKLKIECVQGVDDKLAELQRLADRRGWQAARLAYVGNDINDLACLRWVGYPVAVRDALPVVRRVCPWVTRLPGGHGAVREVADHLLAGRR